VSLSQVVVLLDIYSGEGELIQEGQASFYPSAPLTDPTDHLYVWQTPITVSLVPPAGAAGSWLPYVPLFSTDSSNLSPSGWTWNAQFQAVGGPAAFSFNLAVASTSHSFTATSASPCVFTAAGTAYSAGTPVSLSNTPLLSGSSLPAGFSAAQPYYVVSPSGDTFQLAATPGGSPIGSTSTGSGTVVPCQYIDDLAPVASLGAQTASLPMPSGTPVAGDVPLVQVNGSAQTEWGSPGGGLSNPMTVLGDTIYGGTSGSPSRLAGPTASEGVLVSIPSGGTAQAPSWATLQALSDSLLGVTNAFFFRGNGTHMQLSAILAGDLPPANTSVQGAVVFDGSSGDIEPVGSAAAVGATGKVPDAGHVHLGNWGGIFGDGSDGALALNGTNTYPGMNLTGGNTYTLTRDIFASSIVFTSGITLKPAGCRIFCIGSITGTGTISANGNNASGAVAGANTGSAILAGGRPGGAGGATTPAAGSAGTNAPVGFGAAGAGGTGSSGAEAGGTAGTSTANITYLWRLPVFLLTGNIPAIDNSVGGFVAGGPGGGGGGGSTTGTGGGGGSGGGPIAVFAYSIASTITMTSTGGNGAAGTGNGGGGGAGTGGLIVAYTLAAYTGTMTVTAGSPGAGSGTGVTGGTASAGFALNEVLV
jgi:hypothetical protein